MVLCSRTALEGPAVLHIPVLLLIVGNPLHMSTLVSVVGIPLYRLVIVRLVPRLKNVRMLTKMWMGLYLSLLQVVLYIIVVVDHDTRYWQQHHTVIHNEPQYPPSRECYIIRTGCDFLYGLDALDCQQYNDPVDNTYLWFIIPQLVSSLLETVEFISRLLALPRGCSLVCGMPHSASGT